MLNKYLLVSREFWWGVALSALALVVVAAIGSFPGGWQNSDNLLPGLGVALVLGVVGAALILAGRRGARRQLAFIMAGTPSHGVVTGARRVGRTRVIVTPHYAARRRVYRYYLDFGYLAPEAGGATTYKLQKSSAEVGRSYWRSHQPGAHVTVIYDPALPLRSQLDRFVLRSGEEFGPRLSWEPAR